MSLEITVRLKLHSAIRTQMFSVVAVHAAFVWLQAARVTETSVAQWTRVWFVPRVDGHVALQTRIRRTSLVADEAFVRFVSAVKPAVSNQTAARAESLVTNSTCERSLSRMTSPVYHQFAVVSTILSTVRTRVLPRVNVHVCPQVAHRCKTFLALRARIRSFSVVRLYVLAQICRVCKPFVTHRT